MSKKRLDHYIKISLLEKISQPDIRRLEPPRLVSSLVNQIFDLQGWREGVNLKKGPRVKAKKDNLENICVSTLNIVYLLVFYFSVLSSI